jgi:hypothetical protein
MNYDELYKKLAELPPEEGAGLIRELIPPAALAMRMGGTAFAVHKYGLRLFETKGGLKDIGIPADDPRSKLYQSLSGKKIASDLPNKIRAIAAREETVGRQSGGIQIWGDGRYLWYVPAGATSKFLGAMQGLANEISDVVNKELIANYDQLRVASRQAFLEASSQAWDDMNKLKRTTERKAEYVNRSMQLFETSFPSLESIRSRIGFQVEPAQAPLPTVVETTFEEIKAAEIAERQATAEAMRAQSEAATMQQQLFSTELMIEEEKLEAERSERKVRDQLLRKAIAPELDAAQQMVAQFQTSLISVAAQIASAIKEGKPISVQTKRSWSDKLARLKELQAFGLPEVDEALRQLNAMVGAPKVATKDSVRVAETTIKTALTAFEHDAAAEIGADSLWKMITEGKGDDALKKIINLEDRFQGRLDELSSIREFVTDRLADET